MYGRLRGLGGLFCDSPLSEVAIDAFQGVGVGFMSAGRHAFSFGIKSRRMARTSSDKAPPWPKNGLRRIEISGSIGAASFLDTPLGGFVAGTPARLMAGLFFLGFDSSESAGRDSPRLRQSRFIRP
jgi:hypothetical protein